MTPQEKKMTDLCVKFAAVDLRPFQIVNGKGFKELAQGLINIGDRHGKINVNQVLPHPTTISRKTSAVAQRVREDFLPEVRKAIQDGACALESDMWTDKYTKRAYLTVDCQYCTPNFELKSLTLFTKEFPPRQKKTGENIREFFEKEMREMGLPTPLVKRAAINTDEGSNMVKAFEDYQRLSCNAHVLATVLRNIFDFNKNDKEKSFLFTKCPLTYECVKACLCVATYIKISGKNLELARSVKLMVETRWNTLVDMIESVCLVMPQIRELLEEEGKSDKLDRWDGEIATQLVEFLTPFRTATLDLQSKKTQTLNLVLLNYFDLLQNCQIDEERDHEVRNLK